MLVLFAAAAYAPVLSCGFIWDDNDYVENNKALESPAGLVRIWTTPTASPQYYPLVFTTFWIERRLYALDPAGYHFVNVLLHAASGILLWRILRRLALPAAWFVAALFVLHPVEVESVAWITERKNVLSGFFYLASALTYLRFRPLLVSEPRPLGSGDLVVGASAVSPPSRSGLGNAGSLRGLAGAVRSGSTQQNGDLLAAGGAAARHLVETASPRLARSLAAPADVRDRGRAGLRDGVDGEASRRRPGSRLRADADRSHPDRGPGGLLLFRQARSADRSGVHLSALDDRSDLGRAMGVSGPRRPGDRGGLVLPPPRRQGTARRHPLFRRHALAGARVHRRLSDEVLVRGRSLPVSGEHRAADPDRRLCGQESRSTRSSRNGAADAGADRGGMAVRARRDDVGADPDLHRPRRALDRHDTERS